MTNNDIALSSNAWPFQEAEQILKRIGGKTPKKGYVLFETGYGPSGLPHIGTFGEVARTTMVRRAFQEISDIPTRLFAFSDDMDGMRKIPDNVPQKDMLKDHLHKPLTSVPDPFGTHESYGHNMNSRLRSFLDRFGFDYEFKSATDVYKSGQLNEYLLKVLDKYDEIMAVMLPTLGEERQQTYSPFLPVCPESGQVLQVPVVARDLEKGTITYENTRGEKVEVPVTNGHCKLQWKPDLGTRWAALDVDFEMYGKDHLANGPLYSKICEIVGGNPPQQLFYELFLDDKGQKISKSKGNGLTIEEWLRYGPTESVSYYMFQAPRKAKRLYFDVIPKAVDEYQTFLAKYPTQDAKEQYANPVWHIHSGKPPAPETHGLSYALLLNLASACNPEDESVLWGFIKRYAPDVTPQNSPLLAKLVQHAIHYYEDFVKPSKKFRAATDTEQQAFKALVIALKKLPQGVSPEEIQNEVYAVGTDSGITEMKDWFKALYEVLLGQSQGPRFGSFVALYGIDETVHLIERALRGEDLAA